MKTLPDRLVQFDEPANQVDRLRLALLGRGYTLSSWAIANNYLPGTVQRVVWRARHEPMTRRRGLLTYRIIADLTRDLEMTIVPGIPPSPFPGREAA